jgi:hypothetical protein
MLQRRDWFCGDDEMNRIVKEINADPELRERLMKQFRKEGRPLSRQAIHAWKALQRGVPVHRVATVARLMGRKRYEIRPDIWPPPASAA